MQFVLAAGRLLRGAARAYVQTSLCEIILNANRFIFCRSPTSADSEDESCGVNWMRQCQLRWCEYLWAVGKHKQVLSVCSRWLSHRAVFTLIWGWTHCSTSLRLETTLLYLGGGEASGALRQAVWGKIRKEKPPYLPSLLPSIELTGGEQPIDWARSTRAATPASINITLCTAPL